MRSTIVPAQITTVEDKIAGNLGVTQVLLLIAPIFGGSALYVALPPFFGYAAYKVSILTLLALLCGLLAVRIKGKIVLVWLIVRATYNTRPAYYVFNKNSTFSRRPELATPEDEPQATSTLAHTTRFHASAIDPADYLRAEQLITNPGANVRFIATKKGALRVHLTEVTREGVDTPAD